MKKKVLIVESDPVGRRSLHRMLFASYKVIIAQEKKTIVEEIAMHQPDLVLLDRTDACEPIRKQWPGIAIVVFSHEAQEKNIVRSLDLGADDYIARPWSSDEVQARIRALLRRLSVSRRLPIQEPDHLQSEDGYLSLNKPHHLAFAGGKCVYLTPTEFAVVWELLLQAGKVIAHRVLLQTVWGPEYANEIDYLRVYIRQIRRKIEADPSNPRYILIKPGVGYMIHCSAEGIRQ